MTKKMKDRKYTERHLVKAVYNEVWALEPGKLSEIQSFLEDRFDPSADLTEDSIRAAFEVKAADDNGENPPLVDGVQVLNCFGTLAPRMNLMMRFSGGTSTEKLAAAIRAATANDMVKTILIRGDSPGGAASHVPEVADALFAAAAAGKRTVSHWTNSCASGAFWIACATQEVYASRSTDVGSLGVYWIHRSDKAANETAGLKYTVMRAGDVKAAGNQYEDLNKQTSDVLQERVNAIYRDFVADSARGRKVGEQTVLDTFGQGTTYLADEAESRGMIDGVDIFENVLQRERERNAGRVRSQSSIVSDVVTVETSLEKRQMKVTQKIKAALFARDLIDSMEASDEECVGHIKSALRLHAFQTNTSANYEAADEAAALVAINATDTPVGAPLEPLVVSAIGGANDGAETSDSTEADVKAAARRGILEERNRIKQIEARAEALGMQEADVEEAINSGRSLESVSESWVQKLSSRQTPLNRVASGDDITFGPSQSDKFVEAATEICIAAAGGSLAATADQKVIRDYGGSLRNARSVDLARIELQAAGIRPSGNEETDALNWLKMNGVDEAAISADAGGSINHPGAHPNLLSNLANKALNRPYPTANVQYQSWSARLPDLPDFKPKAIIDTGIFNELDRLGDDQMPEQKKFDSELASWMQIDRYANRVGLTVVMVANDDLGGFARQLSQLSGAAERTLNKLCLNLLAGNVLMIDGDPLFHANHNNLVTSGGAPSAAQASEMRKMHRLQTHIDAEGAEVPIDEPPSLSLHPSAHEDAAKQVFMKGVYDSKVAQTDANVNTVRGEISPIITSRLDAFSATEWYTLVDPNLIATIAYAHMRGYGSGGRRTTWYENGKGTRWYSLEARFTAAAISWRGAVKNPGV